MTLAEATRRLQERFPRFSAEVAQHMADWGTRQDQGARLWKFDPLHQTQSPQPYYVAQARAFWRRVACPVLYVEGRETPLRLSSCRSRRASAHSPRPAREHRRRGASPAPRTAGGIRPRGDTVPGRGPPRMTSPCLRPPSPQAGLRNLDAGARHREVLIGILDNSYTVHVSRRFE